MVGYSNATFYRNNGIKCFNLNVRGCTQPGWSWSTQFLNRRRGGGGCVLTCLEKTAMSSLKDSEEQTSPPATPGSRGVQVANSHFSKIRASRGNRGWLQQNKVFYQLAQTVILYMGMWILKIQENLEYVTNFSSPLYVLLWSNKFVYRTKQNSKTYFVRYNWKKCN